MDIASGADSVDDIVIPESEKADLSSTEIGVAKLTLLNFNPEEIAEKLDVSANTVRTYRSNLPDDILVNRGGRGKSADWAAGEALENGEKDLEETAEVLEPSTEELEEDDKVLLKMIDRGDGYGIIRTYYPHSDVKERVDELREAGYLEGNRETASGFSVSAEADLGEVEAPEIDVRRDTRKNRDYPSDSRTTWQKVNLGDYDSSKTQNFAYLIVEEVQQRGGEASFTELAEEIGSPETVRIAVESLEENDLAAVSEDPDEIYVELSGIFDTNPYPSSREVQRAGSHVYNSTVRKKEI